MIKPDSIMGMYVRRIYRDLMMDGHTQTEISKKIGISRVTLWRYRKKGILQDPEEEG